MKWIRRLVNKIFPLNVGTFEEFLKSFQRNGCSEVSACVYILIINSVFTASVGDIGNLQYWVKLESKTPDGRKIKLEKLIFENFGSTRGFSDSEERDTLLMRSLIEADKLLKEVRGLKPDVKTTLLKPDESPFSEKEIKNIRKLAKEKGLVK